MPKIVTLSKILFAAVMVLGLGWWVQAQYGWSETLSVWKNVSPVMVVMGILFVVSSHLARAARVHFAYSLLQKTSFKRTLAVSLVHNTVSFLLPMRLGEIALPALSKHQLRVNAKYATATLLLIRLFDAHVLLCLLLLFAGNVWLKNYAIIAPLLLIALLPIGMRLIQSLSKRFSKLAFATTLFDRHVSWIGLYAYTVAIWVVKLLALALLAAALGKLPIAHAWIATIIADGSALSPITGFANAGTYELAFALPLMPMGFDAEPLVKTAVNVHLFIFIINICVGIAGFLMLDSSAHQRADNS